MKTTDPRDALDRKIDALLSEQPLRASDDFRARTLSAVDADRSQTERRKFRRHFRLALATAAGVALALFLGLQSRQSAAPENPPAQQAPVAEVPIAEPFLESSELEELLHLQEKLSGLTNIEQDLADSTNLLQTLDTLQYGFES
ncbi:MAG: hypothetical protein ACLFU4_09545 [Opitutales bacterium]